MILQVLGPDGPTVVRAGRVVVLLDDAVTPVAAAVDAEGGVAVEQAADREGRGNPAFARLMAAWGMDRSLVLARAPLPRLDSMRFR